MVKEDQARTLTRRTRTSGQKVLRNKDKGLHALVWFILVLGLAPIIGLVPACALGIGIGIGKEIADHYTGGHADPWDFVADLIGIIIAFTVASYGGIG